VLDTGKDKGNAAAGRFSAACYFINTASRSADSLPFLLLPVSTAWRREVARARALMCQVAVKRMGYSEARVARFLEVTTSTVNRIAGRDVIDDLERYVR
jgi:hypothetical protein